MKFFRPLLCLIIFIFTLFRLYAVAADGGITISHNLNNPPFKFVNASGEPDGILIDFWKFWSEKTGVPVEFSATDFNSTIQMVSDGRADVNAGLFYSEERDRYLDFSDPVIDVDYYIFTERRFYENGQDIDRLKPFRIGVPEGYTADIVKKNHAELSTVIFPDLPSVYEAAHNGDILVFVSPAENYKYYLQSTGQESSFVLFSEDPLYSMSYRGAVREGNSSLLKIINKGIARISSLETESIKTGWFDKIRNDYALSHREMIMFSDEEEKWLAGHSEITVTGDPDWPPNSYYDNNGIYSGIVADLWDLIERRSGLRFKRVRSSDWAESLDMVRKGEVQVIDCVSETPERKDFMIFSDVMFSSNIVLVGREDTRFVNGISDIGELTLAVQEGVSEIELLKKDHPDIRLSYYSDPDMAYRDVSAGKVDLFLRHQSDFSFKQKEKMLTNLKIVGPTDYTREYRIGVSKGNRELAGIMNTIISHITQEEKNNIFDKWYGREKAVVDYGLLWKIVLSALVVIALVFYWNRTLAREVELRKKAQAALEIAIQKAEEATKAKSVFLANMSHEIRTPMNAVIGFSDLLKKTPMTSEQNSYLSTIKSAGTTLLNIINDILDISKVEANKIELNYSFFDLCSMMFDLTQFFDEKIRSKNLTFKVSCDHGGPLIVYLDEMRLRQILTNLISNAVKFTSSGWIGMGAKAVKNDDGTVDISITVSDTGIGIPEEDLGKIFDAFEQSGQSIHSKKYQGTGLGLAITKKFSELMKGSVRVTSEVGKGSEFTVSFRNVKTDGNSEKESASNEKEQSPVKFSKAKVLVADDIVSNRFLLTELCAGLGLETVEAANGREAVEKAKLYVPDLILLDMRMPEMDGYEAIEILKNDPATKKIPVIAVTASVMGNEMARIEKLRFDGFVRKPVSLNDLIGQMKKVLRYEVIEELKDESSDESESITDAGILYEKLTSVYKDQVNEAKQTHNFSQIGRIASELNELAEIHGSGKLRNFSRGLMSAVQEYDVEKIKIFLDNFNDTTDNLMKTQED
ncbi:MAG: transporter substrate-binding domain-containing protein [Candidatus Delongbacteria bacterium]|nr:transporter substrate-binding domain-containing protein [Candidatus Delongbacteria bacterium]